MARLMIRKIDRLINILTMSVLVGGGLTIHILTALTLKSYYGTFWGIVSFLFPLLSEIYLGAVQVSESMFNYMKILTAFMATSAILYAVWSVKNLVKAKAERAFEGQL